MTTKTTTADIHAEMAALEATQTFKGHTIADLRTAFDRIANPENWKLRVAGLIRVADFDLTAVAVEFFAGSPLTLVYAEPEHFGPDRRAFVEGAGYYACVGA